MAEPIHEHTPLLSSYQLRLPTYEGPLDVLLRLIERSQLAIEDVSLVKVTDQFLTFITEMIDAPPDIVADFTAVGARLAVLKSRSLLPTPTVVAEEQELSDITLQLKEYKRIKDIARHLGEVHAAGLNAYTSDCRGAIVLPAPISPAKLAQHEPALLTRSLRRRLAMAPKTAQRIRQRRSINLREVVDRISEQVCRMRMIRFSRVLRDYETRTEVATAFLAILILIRRQSLAASQSGLFADISLETLGQPSAHRGSNGARDAEPPSRQGHP